MEQWWCLDCLAEIETDLHGRCGTCGSEALGRIGYSERVQKTHLASPAAELQRRISLQGSVTALSNSLSRLLRRMAPAELVSHEHVCTH